MDGHKHSLKRPQQNHLGNRQDNQQIDTVKIINKSQKFRLNKIHFTVKTEIVWLQLRLALINHQPIQYRLIDQNTKVISTMQRPASSTIHHESIQSQQIVELNLALKDQDYQLRLPLTICIITSVNQSLSNRWLALR